MLFKWGDMGFLDQYKDLCNYGEKMFKRVTEVRTISESNRYSSWEKILMLSLREKNNFLIQRKKVSRSDCAKALRTLPAAHIRFRPLVSVGRKI
jgi:hypothetical protein